MTSNWSTFLFNSLAGGAQHQRGVPSVAQKRHSRLALLERLVGLVERIELGFAVLLLELDGLELLTGGVVLGDGDQKRDDRELKLELLAALKEAHVALLLDVLVLAALELLLVLGEQRLQRRLRLAFLDQLPVPARQACVAGRLLRLLEQLGRRELGEGRHSVLRKERAV